VRERNATLKCDKVELAVSNKREFNGLCSSPNHHTFVRKPRNRHPRMSLAGVQILKKTWIPAKLLLDTRDRPIALVTLSAIIYLDRD
jgi:hypothetical protein